ncbi:hypothetical protein BGZ60DRAFT_539677 [Tricladium varicosporioides]|nr:hypothetical protein BGZ60DRAFT_539677 [Hymenoscyphus varicosporioides]
MKFLTGLFNFLLYFPLVFLIIFAPLTTSAQNCNENFASDINFTTSHVVTHRHSVQKITKAKTYNSRDSLMVTHSTTSLPI